MPAGDGVEASSNSKLSGWKSVSYAARYGGGEVPEPVTDEDMLAGLLVYST